MVFPSRPKICRTPWGNVTWLHIILVKCSSSLSYVRNFSEETAIVAPLKNLSLFMKNRTFLAFFSVEALIKDARWVWICSVPPISDGFDSPCPFPFICDDDVLFRVGVSLTELVSEISAFSRLFWAVVTWLMDTFLNETEMPSLLPAPAPYWLKHTLVQLTEFDSLQGPQ